MRKLMPILVLATAAAIVGCRATAPVQNVSGAPIEASIPNPSLDAINKAIIRAGSTLGWQMTPKKPGLIEAELRLRTHMARVNIHYDTKTYSITYADSHDLAYDGANIHPNYNGWVQNLDRAIRAQLSTL